MNIEEYKFDDEDVVATESKENVMYVHFADPNNEFYLHKDDVIALAKHFKLTSEDIKEGEHENPA